MSSENGLKIGRFIWLTAETLSRHFCQNSDIAREAKALYPVNQEALEPGWVRTRRLDLPDHCTPPHKLLQDVQQLVTVRNKMAPSWIL